jgi:D-proline reductase (dithiol) PrdB
MPLHAESDVDGAVFDFDRVYSEVLHVSPMNIPVFEPPRLTPLSTTLDKATVGLLVTSGAYYPDQERMRTTNDLSYRLLPRDRDLAEVLFAHMTPIRAFALADPNVAYPRDSLIDLEQDGTIGRYADNAISMVGSISRYEELATDTAQRIVDEFTAMGTDLVLVVPFCPKCHIAGGVLARAMENRGLPTTSLATLHRHTGALKPPRATFLDFPLGCPGGRPNRPDQQREIVRAALQAGVATAGTDWTLPRLPFRWTPDGDRGWENLVVDLYRLDSEIRGTVVANRSTHEHDLVGHEREFTIRCAC